MILVACRLNTGINRAFFVSSRHNDADQSVLCTSRGIWTQDPFFGVPSPQAFHNGDGPTQSHQRTNNSNDPDHFDTITDFKPTMRSEWFASNPNLNDFTHSQVMIIRYIEQD